MLISSSLLLLIIIFCYNQLSYCIEEDNWLKPNPNKCRHIWRPDKLQGRCFGLKNYNEFDEIKHIKSVENSEQCRALCCNLDSKCVSWQFQKSNKECKLGWSC